MKNKRKTIWGGLLAIFLGTTCCWLSSIAIWAGGAGALAIAANYLESIQSLLISIGILLLLIAAFNFNKKTKYEN